MTKNKKIIGLVVLLLAVVIGAIFFASTAVDASYFLEVNPGIQIDTNARGKVVNLKGLNEDGKQLLSGYQIDDNDLDDVIEDLVDRMIITGYLGPNSENVIMVSVDDRNPRELDRLKEKINDRLSYRNINGTTVTVITDGDYDENDLDNINMSLAKYELLTLLKEVNPNISLSQMENLSIGEIITILRYENVNLDDFFYDYDDLDDFEDHYLLDDLEDLNEEEDLDDIYDDLDDQYDDADDIYDDIDDYYEEPTPAPQPAPSAQPAPAPQPKPAPVYYDDDEWDDDWDDYDDDDDWDDDDDDDDDD